MILAAGHFDDGIQLTSAMFELRGQRPNVDFLIIYPPLNSYLLAGAFRLLGQSVVVYRLVQTLAHALLLAALWWLFQRRRPSSSAAYAAVPVVLVLTATLPAMQSLTALTWSTLSAVALLEARRSAGTLRRLLMLLAGLALGATVMTRLNFALYLAAAWFVDVTWTTLSTRTRAHTRSTALDSAVFLAAAAATVAAVLLAWGGSVQKLVHEVAVVPSKFLALYPLSPVPAELNVSGLRLLLTAGVLVIPLPSAWLALRASALGRVTLSRWLWAITLSILLAALVIGRWYPALLPVFTLLQLGLVLGVRSQLDEPLSEAWLPLLMFVFGMHYALSRADGVHTRALLPPLAMLAIVAATSAPRRTWLGLLGLLLVTCGGSALYSLRLMAARVIQDGPSVARLGSLIRSEDSLLSSGCDQKCSAFLPEPDVLQATTYIRERTAATENVFSGMLRNERNDNVNDIRAYWLMRRGAGTRHVMMMGNLTTTAEAEQEIVFDLQARRVRWLLLWSGLTPPDLSRPATSRLDRFIADHFRTVARFGDYHVLQRTESGDG
jgi:hypothetical protein